MSENIKVAISSDFLTAFAALPRQVQGKVTEFINKFRNNPKAPGINFEKLDVCLDKKICSVRIDQTYRGILVRQEETGVYLLLWVDHHDEAYAWAKNKRCEVNQRTGAIQVFDVITETESASVESEKPIFSHVGNKDLLALNVPEEQIPFIHSLKSIQDFNNYKSAFSPDVYESLSWITEGFPVSEVIEMYNEDSKDKASDGNLAVALNSPETLKSFVVVEGEDELRNIMAEPLEKWRIFLHPTQRKIAEKTYSGPARVLGTAGTGKTVVAMHRARFLASKLGEKEKILFTTFTKNLASDIRENLRKICTIEEFRKIDVINLDAFVAQYLKAAGFSAEIKYGEEMDEYWKNAIEENPNDLPVEDSFYEEEWNRVVVAQEAFTLEAYIKASRNGRGTRLDRKSRMQVWKVFESYQNAMKEDHVRDVNTAMYECKLLISKNTEPLYKNIIVDEGQDFSANAFRLLREMAGKEREDDIFIVGDSHQRIYKNKASLSRSGINIRGRSGILRINYRTTEEIRKCAIALLEGLSFDDLDEETLLDEKCQSLTHGDIPVLKHFSNANEEMDFIVSEIKKLTDNGVNINDICIVARTKKMISNYIADLTQKGIRLFQIKPNTVDDRSFDGLRIATMHRVKGLEFQYVFVVAMNKGIVPLPSAIAETDAVSKQETITAEKCLLYVSVTRAQKGAYITSYGTKSEFLK